MISILTNIKLFSVPNELIFIDGSVKSQGLSFLRMQESIECSVNTHYRFLHSQVLCLILKKGQTNYICFLTNYSKIKLERPK